MIVKHGKAVSIEDDEIREVLAAYVAVQTGHRVKPEWFQFGYSHTRDSITISAKVNIILSVKGEEAINE